MRNKRNKGITLIALVVTIIVLLILAGISISMLSGDNGILQRAATAKTETEIGQEKEIIALAYNASLAKKRGDMYLTQVTAQDLNPELTKQGASASGDNPIKVTFNDSKRQYIINNGSIEYEGIQSEGELVQQTDIYVAICTNGTLVFSNNEKSIEDYFEDNNTELANGYTIKNIKNEFYYDGFINNEYISFHPKWTEAYELLTAADFLNEIAPTSTSCWFDSLENLTTINHLENLNTSNVTNMSRMFNYCGLTSLDLSNFDTKNVIDMSYMFSNTSIEQLNLSTFNTKNVTNMCGMFSECSNLSSLNITSFNTSKVTNLSYMFYNCSNLTSLDLSNFNTSNVTDMSGMFEECINIQTIYASDNFVTNSLDLSEGNVGIFSNCVNLVGGEGSNYSQWTYTGDNDYAHIDGGMLNPGFFTAK